MNGDRKELAVTTHLFPIEATFQLCSIDATNAILTGSLNGAREYSSAALALASFKLEEIRSDSANRSLPGGKRN